MSDTEYLKCPCKECGNNIEYPTAAARSTITCPHCGEWTELPSPQDKAGEQPVARRRRLARGTQWTIIIVVVLLVAIRLTLLVVLPLAAVAAGAYFILHHSHVIESEKKPLATAPALKPVKTPVVSMVPQPESGVVSNPVTAVESTPSTAPAEKRPKSPADLVIGKISLDKTKGTGLIHVIGTIKNNSDYQRFSVKITLDLFNNQGVKIGTAEDQKSVIEPREKWKFHALVADPKAASATLVSLTEEN